MKINKTKTVTITLDDEEAGELENAIETLRENCDDFYVTYSILEDIYNEL